MNAKKLQASQQASSGGLRYIVGPSNVKTDVVLPVALYDQLVSQNKKLAEEIAALRARLEENEASNREFHYSAKGVSARGRCCGPFWVVLKTSTAAKHGAMIPLQLKIQKQLRENGVLVDKGSHYEFSQDWYFGSPSLAISIVENASRDGPDKWLDVDGVSFKPLKEDWLERLNSPPA